MNWKDFFRPTLWKLFITLIIFFSVIMGCSLLSIPPTLTDKSLYNNPYSCPAELHLYSSTRFSAPFLQIAYLGILIAIYLIVCLIIFAYNKFKLKNYLE